MYRDKHAQQKHISTHRHMRLHACAHTYTRTHGIFWGHVNIINSHIWSDLILFSVNADHVVVADVNAHFYSPTTLRISISRKANFLRCFHILHCGSSAKYENNAGNSLNRHIKSGRKYISIEYGCYPTLIPASQSRWMQSNMSPSFCEVSPDINFRRNQQKMNVLRCMQKSHQHTTSKYSCLAEPKYDFQFLWDMPNWILIWVVNWWWLYQ